MFKLRVMMYAWCQNLCLQCAQGAVRCPCYIYQACNACNACYACYACYARYACFARYARYALTMSAPAISFEMSVEYTPTSPYCAPAGLRRGPNKLKAVRTCTRC